MYQGVKTCLEAAWDYDKSSLNPMSCYFLQFCSMRVGDVRNIERSLDA